MRNVLVGIVEVRVFFSLPHKSIVFTNWVKGSLAAS